MARPDATRAPPQPRVEPAEGLLKRLALAALAALVLAGGLARRRAAFSRAATAPSDEDGRTYHHAALNLRSGTLSFDDPSEDAPRAPGATRAPLFPLALALSPDGGGPAGFFWRAQGAWGLALAALAAGLAAAAAGPLAGLAAGAALAFDPLTLQHAGTLNIQLFFGALTACVGLALLSWGRAPTPGAAALAGAVVGASLLARSTLAPFLLFLPAWLALSRPKLKKPGLQLALFWGAALLVFLPWLVRNGLLLGRLQPFEAGVVEYGLVAGASGRISDDLTLLPGRGTVSLDDAGRQRRGTWAAFGEAARLAAARPADAARAAAARAAFWGWGLLAWPVAAFALYRARRNDLGLWTLGGLAVYWNVHLLMLSSARHFIPAFAPLAAVAAAAFASRRPAASPRERLATAAVAAWPLLLAALCWAALARELANVPWAGAGARRLEAVAAAVEAGRADEARLLLAARPAGPAWQDERAARLLQKLGDHAACEKAFAALADAHPRGGRFAADAAVCASLAGRAAPAEALARRALAAEPGFLPAALTLGALLERRGRREEAARIYAAALAASRRPPEDPLARAVADALSRPR